MKWNEYTSNSLYFKKQAGTFKISVKDKAKSLKGKAPLFWIYWILQPKRCQNVPNFAHFPRSNYLLYTLSHTGNITKPYYPNDTYKWMTDSYNATYKYAPCKTYAP